MKLDFHKHKQAILLVLIATSCVTLLALAKGTDAILARAAMMQGVASIALLYVTWISISRSDEQVRISNEILMMEYRHCLAVNIDLHGDEIYLANLSKLPILVLDIRYEVIAPNRPRNFSLVDNFIIESGNMKVLK